MSPQLGFPWGCCLFISILLLCSVVSGDDDGAAMEAIRKAINPVGWNGSDYCNWAKVTCCTNSRSVCRIQIGNQKLSGELPPVIKTLIQLQTLEAMNNQLTGPLPSLSGLTSLQIVLLNNNNFTLFPDDFFVGLSSLSTIDIGYNSFDAWRIPESLKQATAMRSFSANDANISGNIPDFLGNDVMASLSVLRLALNQLEGELPESFSGSEIQTLWLNGNNLNGTIGVIQSMTSLTQVWLQGNQFTGPLPDFSNLASLKDFNARDNQLTGVVPSSLVKLNPNVTLSNNLLQGPMPSFSSSAQVDIQDGNRFCTQKEGGDCDPRVDVLLSIVKEVGYPNNLAADWVGNDPCHKNGGGFWLGLTCSAGGNITGINFGKMGLTGTISSNFSLLTSLQTLKLNDNLLNGTIPEELTRLPNLKNVDLSNNKLYGKVPSFGPNVTINVAGNTDIGKDNPSVTPPGAPTGPDSNKKSKTGVIVGVVVGSVVGLVLIGLLVFCLIKRTQRRSNRVQSPNILVIRPHQSSDQNAVKISVANRVNVSGGEPHTINGPNDIHVEAGNMIISIQVLRSATNNFSEDKILGKGGFGTVYEGELHDGTKIAVKRMESGVVAEKGLNEFKSEIAVLTKVRHRHLVGLLGYCLDGNERLLVYEHMPQGTLSRHLFHWKDEGLQPLEWTRRLIIALDVARGVEYLHGLANEIFIHRDLKPSNILLGDDMRAKVADFGLVRLAPAGKGSIETRLAGTFGYLAPEYAATGRMTLKVDVYSFGVILMELITGRKAIDESQPEESCHLVTWFRRKVIKTEALPEIVDPTIDVTEETLSSIRTVAELAGHCSAREPYQRPDMGHAVNVLSSLVEQWKPSKQEDIDEMGAINFDVPLNEAVKRWQAAEGTSNVDESIPSSIFPRGFHSETSTPNRPSGFPNSFTSSDGR